MYYYERLTNLKKLKRCATHGLDTSQENLTNVTQL